MIGGITVYIYNLNEAGSKLRFTYREYQSVCVRGRSNKYLAYKGKTKILEKWRFISQHNLLLA